MSRMYRRYSEADHTEFWTRWRHGESLSEIARVMNRTRADASRRVAAGASLRTIVTRLHRAPSTISREVRRHGGRAIYRAATADSAAPEHAAGEGHDAAWAGPG